MKNTHQCPKCQSTELYKKQYKVEGQDPNVIIVKKGFLKNKLISPTLYICTSCGHLEHWIDDQKDIDTIKEAGEDKIHLS